LRELTRILICDSDHASGSALSLELETHGYRPIVTSNPKAVPVLAREHQPRVIIMAVEDPVPLCHELKMNPLLYAIPLFVMVPRGNAGEELGFLANEVLPSPPDSRLLLAALERYVQPDRSGKTSLPKTETRERWIEVRNHSAYLFEYKGSISDERMTSLQRRISELLSVGRNSFTINLTGAEHLDNLSPASFVSLWQMTGRSGGVIRFVLPVSTLASSLAGLGIPVDEYLPQGLSGTVSRHATARPGEDSQ